jgi:hypothetical protein
MIGILLKGIPECGQEQRNQNDAPKEENRKGDNNCIAGDFWLFRVIHDDLQMLS